MTDQTLKGVTQIKPLDPFILQQAETTAATQNIQFQQGEESGNMWATTIPGKTGILCVRGAKFGKSPSALQIYASGKGTIEVYTHAPEGETIASIEINNPDMQLSECKLLTPIKGNADIYFVLKGEQIRFDQWQFIK